jgi:5'-nucleotidase
MYQKLFITILLKQLKEMVRILKGTKCDLVVCLSHLGYNYKNEPNKICDLKLAALTEDIG